MNEQIKAHYRRRLADHGPSAQAVQYRDEASQFARFRILLEPVGKSQSVLDFGCGLGHLLRCMREGGFSGRYYGLELVEEFVEAACRTFKSDRAATFSSDVDLKTIDEVDWCLISGVFNNVEAGGIAFLKDTLANLWDKSRMGISFNFMSSLVEYQDEGLAYFDVGEIYTFLRSDLKAYVDMKNDYSLSDHGFPFEVSVVASKHPARGTKT